MIIFPKTSLYAKDQHGAIRVWSIGAEKLPSHPPHGSHVQIEIEYGKLGGDLSKSYEYIDEGLAGRTVEEQALLRVESRINKKLDSGHVRTPEEAQNNPRVNKLGLKRPMQGKVYKSVIKQLPFHDGIFIQRKYNGHRCLVTNQNGELIAYSRGGKIINSIDHILAEIDIPEGMTIDGELYHHGSKLQTIGSWIKRKQDNTKKLTYIIYDVMADEKYSHRLTILSNMKWLKHKAKHSLLAETEVVYTHGAVITLRDYYMTRGFEGAILRVDDCGYQDGKRSKSLVKVKRFLDDEFLIVDITASGAGWAILHCNAKNGKRFSVSAPGDMEEKTRIFKNKDEYLGRFVNVEYPELTADGKPSQPVAKFFRDKNSE